jgi:hypothetical protein
MQRQGGVDWATYAKDARDLVVATASAGPTALRVWTAAWCKWMNSAAGTQHRIARGWLEIVREPGRGGTLLGQMREDVKQYLIEVGSISEQAVLEFLEAMAENADQGTGTERTPEELFADAADEVLTAAADAFAQIQAMGEGSPGTAEALLAELRAKVSKLAAQRKELRAKSRRPSR